MKSLWSLTLALTVSISAATTLNSRAHAAALSPQDQELNLRLTHTMFAAILGAYFVEGEETFKTRWFAKSGLSHDIYFRFLANKQYFKTFLNDWVKLLETGKYRSSEEIIHIYVYKGCVLYIHIGVKGHGVWTNDLHWGSFFVQVGSDL